MFKKLKPQLLFILLLYPITSFTLRKKAYMNPELTADERARLLVKEMTLEEKIAQLYTFDAGREVTANQDHPLTRDSIKNALKYGTGFYFIGHQIDDPEKYAEHINELQHFFVDQTRLGIPAIFGAESLHGFVAKGATAFPQNIALGETFDTTLIERIYAIVAREMRVRGISHTFSPNIDLGREPRFGRVEETYGEDPYLVSRLGLAAVRGYQGRNPDEQKGLHTAVTLKHFAGHGEPMGGRNLAPIDNINSIYFRENHLLPFQTCIQEGNALGVMASYNDAGAIPNHANPELLHDVLITELKFQGYVISDCDGVSRLVNVQKAAGNSKKPRS